MKWRRHLGYITESHIDKGLVTHYRSGDGGEGGIKSNPKFLEWVIRQLVDGAIHWTWEHKREEVGLGLDFVHLEAHALLKAKITTWTHC